MYVFSFPLLFRTILESECGSCAAVDYSTFLNAIASPPRSQTSPSQRSTSAPSKTSVSPHVVDFDQEIEDSESSHAAAVAAETREALFKARLKQKLGSSVAKLKQILGQVRACVPSQTD
jgi:hypothetical protein